MTIIFVSILFLGNSAFSQSDFVSSESQTVNGVPVSGKGLKKATSKQNKKKSSAKTGNSDKKDRK